MQRNLRLCNHPGIAAPPSSGFLLRQYRLTISDDLLGGASEWRVSWQVILPVALSSFQGEFNTR